MGSSARATERCSLSPPPVSDSQAHKRALSFQRRVSSTSAMAVCAYTEKVSRVGSQV